MSRDSTFDGSKFQTANKINGGGRTEKFTENQEIATYSYFLVKVQSYLSTFQLVLLTNALQKINITYRIFCKTIKKLKKQVSA